MALVGGRVVNPPDDAIEAATRLLGASPVVNALEAGSQAYAWLLSHGSDNLVLRVAKQCGDLGLVTDLRVRNSLAGSKFVPRNRDSGQTWDGKAWLIDECVSGTHPDRGEIGEAVTQQIGVALSELHQIPVSGSGRIEPMEAGLCGGASAIWEGLFSRFDLGPEPDDLDAVTHMVLSDQPDLSSSSAISLKELQNALLLARPAVCHADLHERQIFLAGDKLSGLIDFGHAVIAAPCIDFASFVYFHGLEALPALREGYRSNGTEPPSLSNCLKATILIAIHHLHRSSLPGKEHRREFAIQRLYDVIDAEQ